MPDAAPKLIEILIDGQAVSVPPGTTLLKAAEALDIPIPTFCYHQGLSLAANCRMCLVETNKAPKLLPACQATVMPEMEVQTRSERVLKAREGILEFILLHHPVDCPICDQAGECTLQDHYDEHSLIPSEHEFRKDHKAKAEDIGPRVMLDAERCILCTRCVRFTTEIVGKHQITVKNRGDHAEITVFPGEQLDNDYALCAVDLCPVGALTSRDFRFKRRVWFLEHTETICTGCARGCDLRADHCEGRLERLIPLFNAKVNQWWACDAGRLSFRRYEAGRAISYLLAGAPGAEPAALARAAELIGDLAQVDLAVSPLLPLEDLHLAMGFAKARLDGRPVYVSSRPEGAQDDILIRGDKDPNQRGLALLAAHHDLETRPLAEHPGGARVLLALCPEEPADGPLATLAAGQTQVILTASFDDALGAAAAVRLPAASPFERGGLYVNFEGFVQEGRKAVAAPDGARAPWIQLRNLLRAAGLAEGMPATRREAADAMLAAVPALADLDRDEMNREAQRIEVSS
jgi:NADH-quinone oxidoreductase subunit G